MPYFEEIICHKNSENLSNKYLCSGHEKKKYLQIAKYIDENFIRECKIAVFVNGYLISHAGVLSKVYEKLVGEKSSLENIRVFLNACDDIWKRFPEESFLYTAGLSRGGDSVNRGLLWCDFGSDFVDDLHFPQIFGHSFVHSPRKEGRSWCIDSGQNHYAIVFPNGRVETRRVDYLVENYLKNVWKEMFNE